MAQFPANIDLSSLNGSNGFQVSGGAGDFSGTSVASAGDVDADGFADLLIGSPYADPLGWHSGASYVVFGEAPRFTSNIDLSSPDGSNGLKIGHAVDAQVNTTDSPAMKVRSFGSGASEALSAENNAD